VNLEPTPTAPTAALIAGAGSVDNVAHRYLLTFVTPDGETNAGDISSPITVIDKTANGKVQLTGIPVGGTFVTARRVYRTKANLDTFFLVATIADNSSTTYLDNVADSALGVGVPTVNTTQSPTLLALIQTAREAAETTLKRALLTQQWAYSFSCFPMPYSGEARINLPRPNLLSVESITYLDFNGAQQTLDPSVYMVDTTTLPGCIFKRFAKIWPVTYPVGNSVTVNYTAGYGATRDTVPQAIKNAMLLHIGDLFANRESVITGTIFNELPAYKRLLNVHRYSEMV
jgi:uncharacterized phiE125 gp8 family phage protein